MVTIADRLSLPLSDDLALAGLVEDGVPSSAISLLMAGLHLPSIAKTAAYVGISAKTAERRIAAGDRLAVDESERVVRVIRILHYATDVFNSPDAARAWLSSPLAILGGKIPLELIATEPGARAVEQTLGRIEHGVFS